MTFTSKGNDFESITAHAILGRDKIGVIFL